MWRSVFLHEFLGLSIRNYQAVAGSFTTSPALPAPRPEAPGPVVRVRPGQFMRFRPDETWTDVVALSAHLRLRVPTQPMAIPFPIIRVGDGMELTLRFDLPIEASDTPSGVAARGRAALRLGSTTVDLAPLEIPHRTYVDLRVDWHTSGVAALTVQGQIQGYVNGLATGARIALGDILVGGVSPIGFLAIPFYDVSRVFVRAMRRPDSLVGSVRLLGDADLPIDDRLERCVLLRSRQILALMDRIRALVAVFTQQTTSPGDLLSGTISGSFSPEALRARELGRLIYLRFAEMAKARDYSDTGTLLAAFTELLELLHTAAPTEFETLVADHFATTEEDPDCQALAADILARNEASLRPLLTLLDDMNDRLRDVAGLA